MNPTEEEQKLLDILAKPDVTGPAGDSETEADSRMGAEAAVDAAFPQMPEKARRVMARVMTADMPTPEEIAQAEEIARHNAEIDRRRAEELAQRRIRRNSGQKSAKSKRRRGKKRR